MATNENVPTTSSANSQTVKTKNIAQATQNLTPSTAIINNQFSSTANNHPVKTSEHAFSTDDKTQATTKTDTLQTFSPSSKEHKITANTYKLPSQSNQNPSTTALTNKPTSPAIQIPFPPYATAKNLGNASENKEDPPIAIINISFPDPPANTTASEVVKDLFKSNANKNKQTNINLNGDLLSQGPILGLELFPQLSNKETIIPDKTTNNPSVVMARNDGSKNMHNTQSGGFALDQKMVFPIKNSSNIMIPKEDNARITTPAVPSNIPVASKISRNVSQSNNQIPQNTLNSNSQMSKNTLNPNSQMSKSTLNSNSQFQPITTQTNEKQFSSQNTTRTHNQQSDNRLSKTHQPTTSVSTKMPITNTLGQLPLKEVEPQYNSDNNKSPTPNTITKQNNTLANNSMSHNSKGERTKTTTVSVSSNNRNTAQPIISVKSSGGDQMKQQGSQNNLQAKGESKLLNILFKFVSKLLMLMVKS